jgi:RimJ/RimL family protein N-acetyltransferase
MEHKFQEVLTGKHIILRKAEEKDAEDMYHWRSSYSGRFMRVSSDFSVENQRKWIRSRGDNEINYVIIDKQTNESVGAISILDVNEADKIASVGRLLLDDKFLTQSRPYGLEALLLTYEYVFNVMNFRKMTGEILEMNEAMVKLQKFLGMKQEGLLEKHVLILNDYRNICIMSIFKEDFNNTYKKKVEFLLKSFK